MVGYILIYSDMGVALFSLSDSSVSVGGLQPYSSLFRIRSSANSWNLADTPSMVNSPCTLLSLVRTFTVRFVFSFSPTTKFKEMLNYIFRDL